MTNNTAVNEAGAKSKKVTDLFCEGNHPDGPQHAVSHFHDGPAVCGTHYARMNKAEKAAKKGHEKAAVEAAMKEPAPTKDTKQNNRSGSKSAHYTLFGKLDVPEAVGVWIETVAKIRNISTDDLANEILTEYYKQTCPEYLRKDTGESEGQH